MALPRPTETPVAIDRIEFIAPRSAFDVIDLGAVIREATADGVVAPRIDVSPFETHVGWTRVTCRAEMALRLVTAWKEAIGRSTIGAEWDEQLSALRHAALAAYRAYENVRSRGTRPHRRR